MNLRWVMTVGVVLRYVPEHGRFAANASDGWFGSSSKPAANGVTTSGAKRKAGGRRGP